MIELLLNELLSTFPFHFLAYIPFYKKLKYSPLETVLLVCMCQIFYLGIFTILTLAGFSSVWVQYLAVPIFGVLFCLLVQADRGMILFFYMFILDYLLVIRAAAFCICEKLFGFNFFSWQSGFITLFLILCTILLMVKAHEPYHKRPVFCFGPLILENCLASSMLCNPDPSASDR